MSLYPKINDFPKQSILQQVLELVSQSHDFSQVVNVFFSVSRLIFFNNKREVHFVSGWIAVGCAMGAYDKCIEYLNQRKQFGCPLTGFQVLFHSILIIFDKSLSKKT
jgi:hypothetical protein